MNTLNQENQKWLDDNLEEAEHDYHIVRMKVIEMQGIITQLKDRLSIEKKQFKHIRLYTKDGDIACICAEHETAIKRVLDETSNR